MILSYTVKNKDFNINQILQNELNISSRLLFKLIKKNKIYINNKKCDTRSIPNIGDIISINLIYFEMKILQIQNLIKINTYMILITNRYVDI